MALAPPKYHAIAADHLGTIYIKKLNAGERDVFERQASKGGSRALTVAHCAFDDRGMRIFSDDDVSTLALIDADVLDPIVTTALRFNGYTDEEQEKLRKNSNGQAASS